MYLEVSPWESDDGQMIGKHPKEVGVSGLKALGHPVSVIKAVRAKCLDCCGGHPGEVRKCLSVDCALWAFRMGVSPFHGRGG